MGRHRREYLYVGVDNIAQAREHFLSWFAPDAEKREEGNAQGIVYSTPGTGSTVADVTVSNDTRTSNFSKLSFILNGVKPIFVAIPKYKMPYDTAIHQDIYKSKYCPSLGKVQTIGSIIQKDKNLWENAFEEAGLAHPNTAAWIDHTHMEGVQFWDYIYLYSNEYYGDRQTQKAKDGSDFLLKIDWVDDCDIHDGGSY